MKTETTLKRIEKIAKKKDDENWAFRTFLKGCDLSRAEIDARVHQLTEEVSAQIDCTKCANCCKQISPVLDQADVVHFAGGLEISLSEFKDGYLSPAEDAPTKQIFNQRPCPFLQDDRCTKLRSQHAHVRRRSARERAELLQKWIY